MNKIVVFSGGYDSTYMLADVVSKAKSTDRIIAVTIQHTLTGKAKLKREYIAQSLILKELHRRYPDVKLSHEIIKVESDWNFGDSWNNKGLAQPIFWITNVVPLLEDGDEILLGYIKGDDAFIEEHNIRKLFNICCKIQECKDVHINFYNKFFDKLYIIEHLIKDHSYLFDFCVSCESESYTTPDDVCGNCVPCLHLKQALVLLTQHTDEVVREFANDTLRKRFRLKVDITLIKTEDNTESSTDASDNKKEDCYETERA